MSAPGAHSSKYGIFHVSFFLIINIYYASCWRAKLYKPVTIPTSYPLESLKFSLKKELISLRCIRRNYVISSKRYLERLDRGLNGNRI